MSLSVVLTAATGSVIIVTTIVRWVTSYNIHQASPTSLCHLQSEESNGAEEQFDAQPRSVWPVSRWDRSEARDLALTTRDLALTARSLALTTKDLLSLQEISLSLQEIFSHCKRSALTARDLLSLQEILFHCLYCKLSSAVLQLWCRSASLHGHCRTSPSCVRWTLNTRLDHNDSWNKIVNEFLWMNEIDRLWWLQRKKSKKKKGEFQICDIEKRVLKYSYFRVL